MKLKYFFSTRHYFNEKTVLNFLANLIHSSLHNLNNCKQTDTQNNTADLKHKNNYKNNQYTYEIISFPKQM